MHDLLSSLFSHAWEGRRVALYVREQLEYTELHLGMNNESVRSSQVRTRGQSNTGDILVGVCCKQPYQKDIHETFFRQLEEAWHKWLRRQEGEVLSAGPHTYKPERTGQGCEGWGGKLCFSNHDEVEFGILRGQKKSRIMTLDLRRAVLGLFRDLLGRILWHMVLKRGSGKLIDFSGINSSKITRKTSGGWPKSSWQRHKKETYRSQKQGWAIWKKYRNAVWVCRCGVRKAKAHPNLQLLPQVHQNGDLVIKDKRKVKWLNAFFTFTFTGKISLPKWISN